MTLTEWRLKMTENAEKTLSRIGMKADSVKMKMLNLQDKMNRVDGGKLGKGLERQLGGISSTLNSAGIGLPFAGGSLMTTGIIAGTAAMGKGVQQALSYEEALAKVNATAQLTGAAFEGMDKQIRSIADQNKADYSSAAITYEKILSQTNSVNQSFDILGTTLKAAKAGFVETELAGNAIAQTLSAIGDASVKAKTVSDILFAAKRYGAGEFRDFATYLPGLTASGRTAGIDYKENAAIFSYFTGTGNSAERSNMLAENLYTLLGKTEFTSGLKKLGIQAFDKKGQYSPIENIVSSLSKKLAPMSDKKRIQVMKDVLGVHDAQAKSALSTLINNANKFSETLRGINTAAGETDRQYDMTANKLRTLDGVFTSFKNSLTTLGTFIINLDKHFLNLLKRPEEDNAGSLSKILSGTSKYSIKDFDQQQKIYRALGDTVKQVGVSVAPDGKLAFGNQQPDKYMPMEDMFTSWEILKRKLEKQNITDKPDPNLNNQFNTISGGGTQTRNVYVTVHRVMDGDIKIYPSTVKEGMTRMAEDVSEGLVKIINGAEQSLMSN